MKNIEMHLHPEPFERIQSGKKHIEYRLNDEKRKELEIGDTITFYKRPLEEETLVAVITDLKYYPTLLEMYQASFEELEDLYESPEAAVLDTPYYTEEEVAKFGCVAIHFKVVK